VNPTAPVWLNGKLMDPSDAVISVFDHGLTTGDGVFEVILIHAGAPFALARHLDRLARSAGGLGLAPPSSAELRSACEAVALASGLVEGRLRITVTGGRGPLGSDRWQSPPTVVVAASALGPSVTPRGAGTSSASPSGAGGVAVATVPWPRNERGALAGLKTISYADNVMALARANAQGATEAIFANLVGNLCEGTGSNVFVGLEGRLITPPLSAGCLAGVTRALVVEALRTTSDVVVVEEDLELGTLGHAEEAFLASTTRGVQPIALVDGKGLPSCPGPLTVAAGHAYSALLEAGGDP
jgi:branched-chain amino acid aminotransferase